MKDVGMILGVLFFLSVILQVLAIYSQTPVNIKKGRNL